jgi:hypothetical protein
MEDGFEVIEGTASFQYTGNLWKDSMSQADHAKEIPPEEIAWDKEHRIK